MVTQEEFEDHKRRMVGTMRFQLLTMKQRMDYLASLADKAERAKSDDDLMAIESELRLNNL
jgi:hypothetical protein